MKLLSKYKPFILILTRFFLKFCKFAETILFDLMYLVDTHSHLYESDFEEDRSEVLERLLKNGVTRVLLPNIDRESLPNMLALEASNQNLFSSMIGLHPTSVGANYKEELQFIKESAMQHSYCAVGEIGLDFYWDKTYAEEQVDALKEQVGWALDWNLPVALHVRKAMPEIIDTLKGFDKNRLRGVFHSFSGSIESASEIARLGDFYYGINGVVTFKNAGIAEVVKELPLDRIVLETDCPYLTPVPFRGKRNESSYVIYVAEKIAEVKGISVEEVAEQTTLNAKRLFNL